ncbi:hypothetical protein PspLS_02698 [Pyricularia sp. CBS 133598]|nr:hypothetical protein PspLS_02698 [Pyricularia sp. CBS 133598]
MAYSNPANHGYTRTQETELELLRAIEQRENMSSQGYYQPQQQPYYGPQGGYGAPPPQQSQPPYGYAPPPQHNQGPPPPPQYVPNYNANEKQDFAQTFKVEKPKWNDLWAGILFIVFVLGFAAISAISLRGYASSRGTQGGGIYDGRNNFSLSTSTIILFAIVLAVAIVLSYAYVWLARLFPKQFIWVTGILNILMGFATAAYFLYRKQYGAGIVFLIFVILLVVAFITWIPRIPFSALMLRTAVDVAKNHGHVYLVSALGGLLGAAFGAWYSVTLVAVYVRYQPGTTNSPNPSYFCSRNYPQRVTRGALKRSLTYSFGSISLGSLIVAIINFLRQLCSMAKSQAAADGDIVSCIIFACLGCIISILQWAVEFANRYAFCHIALYGKSYFSAAKDTWNAGETHEPVLKQPVKLACIQLASGADKAANLSHARDKVVEASRAGAKIILLPECFNSPYGCDYFPSYAEALLPSPPTREQSPSYHALSDMAKETGAYLIAGSIPELVDGASGDDKDRKYYNTALVFSPSGDLLATHRKVHLFDIDIPGKITFRESDVLSPGNDVTIVDLPPYGKVGVAICYDIRFPELATIAARRGAFALLYPGAFNMTTGPLHWELLARARAVDNQLYVALCSPARDLKASYHAWGHSLVADPMAEVLSQADDVETIVYADLDPEAIEGPRTRIPLRDQRRFDVYPDISKP